MATGNPSLYPWVDGPHSMLGIVFHGFVHPGSRVLTTRRTLARSLRHASDMPWRCARLGHPGIGLRIMGFRANIIRAVLETRQPQDGGTVLQGSRGGDAANPVDP